MANQAAISYSPTGTFQTRIFDVEYKPDNDGLGTATIYQPEGPGPFPAILDVHGGAWNGGKRSNDDLMMRVLASSGVVVAAIEFRMAPNHPYPAQVIDTNYAVRWLKAHAHEFNAEPDSVGGMGSSSGGHTIMLSAMRPFDPRYASEHLPGGGDVDATLNYIISRWGVLDPYARYLYAKEAGMDRHVAMTEAYFLTEEAMSEGNPQQILERGEKVHLPPTLIIQGTDDNNVPQSIPQRFTEAYRAAGGSLEIEYYQGLPHGFANTPGTDTDRACELAKSFVARQLAVKVVT